VPGSQPPSKRSLRSQPVPGGGKLRVVGAIAAAIVLLDAITKLLATHFLAGSHRVELLGGAVQMELYRNFAGPNNILPGHATLISIFAIVAVMALVAVATRIRTTTAAIVLGLMLGGAIGNLLDRLLREPGPLRGGVIDWFKLTDHTNWMNIADLAINGAIVALLVGVVVSWWRERQGSIDHPPREDGAGSGPSEPAT